MPATEKTNGFRLNGWHVLATFVGIFAIVLGINFYMAYKATTTLRGIDVSNAYERGLGYERDVLAAQAQAARQWNVDIAVRPGEGEGQHTVTVTAADKEKRALSGIAAALTLAHPTDATKDMPITLVESALGVFSGKFKSESGKWYLQLKLDQGGETRFRSRNSIKLP